MQWQVVFSMIINLPPDAVANSIMDNPLEIWEQSLGRIKLGGGKGAHQRLVHYIGNYNFFCGN